MKNLVLAKLQALALRNNLPHAWIFAGPEPSTQENSNKLQTASDFSQWLLCTDRQADHACGNCKACKLFVAGSHPDFRSISPQPDSTSINVDDVRDLNEFLAAKAQFSQYKIVLLYPAERLNRQAANALLKNLEEPGANTLIILITSHPDLLLRTIVSRCQIVHFNSDQAQTAANDAIGPEIIADLANLLLTKSVTQLQLVDKWIKQWPNEVLYWFELVLADLIRCRYSNDPSILRYNTLYSEQVLLHSQLPVKTLWLMLQKVQEARRWFANNHKPNLQLILEDILYHGNRR